jgi:small multidrug resistance pump
MAWLLLLVAVVAEVIATSALKLSNGFTRVWPSLVMVCCYSLALYLMSLTLETLPVGVVYAIWSGSGVALISLVGRYFFGQILDRPAVIGIVMIVSGVVILQLFSTSVVR